MVNTKNAIILFCFIPFLIQCDPSQKIYKGAEYQGQIDTSFIETGYDGSGDSEYYYDEENYTETGSDSASATYSAARYQSTTPRSFDLLHTKLEVSFDMQKTWLYGKATLTLKPYYRSQNQLTLDAKGFTINEISMLNGNNKSPLKYSYNTDTIPDTFQIVIDLGKEYKNNEEIKIFIDYIAKPNALPEGGSAAITSDKGLYFINPLGEEKEKPTQIWTQGETEASSCWFPTIDKPNERTTQEMYITVEEKFQTLSNGLLVESKKNTNGTRTDYWKMDLPHAPYLFMMAIGEYAIVKDTWKNIEVNYYVEEKYRPFAKNIFGNTPEMISLFSTKLGVEYPWQKYSQIIVRDYVSGAMENTTATIHGEFLQQTDRELLDETYEDVVSHELFHQWFGDLVTCESWSNLPLNESFATYGEYIWREYKYGRDAADELGNTDLQNYLAEASGKQEDLIRFNYFARDDMFDSHSYAKGGRVLHMLRKYLGDETFYSGLQKYLNDNKFKAVEIQHLRLAFEEITGEDLSWFFNQWFLSSGHPDIELMRTYDSENKNIILTVSQLQDTLTTPIYVLPIDVDIYSNNTVERKRILIDKRIQTFTFPVNNDTDLVHFDAERQLAGTIAYQYTSDEYAFLFNHSKLYLDKIEALNWLAYDHSTNEKNYTIVKNALSDSFWAIRQFAVDTIHLDKNTSEEIKNKIIDIALNDPRSYVRSSAVMRLDELDGIDSKPILEKAILDKSYTVLSSALSSLYIKDSIMAAQYARAMEEETNITILLSVWDILSRAGDAKDNAYFIHLFDTYDGWQRYYIMSYYVYYLQNQKDFTIIKSGVDQFKNVATGEGSDQWYNMFASSYLQTLKDYFNTEISDQNASTQAQWQQAITYLDAIIIEVNDTIDN